MNFLFTGMVYYMRGFSGRIFSMFPNVSSVDSSSDENSVVVKSKSDDVKHLF